ncbi:MAG TPA: class II aldolase/adducin family protein, partial [Anaerolineales bacterium]|nr:class II aldolase/adducin family protein [Anaerolineales bacterium]
LVVDQGGLTGQLHVSPHRRFQRLTSEFNSHLAVHADQIGSSGTNFHAVIHAQPPYMTYLSHIARYQDETCPSRGRPRRPVAGALLRWQPENIVQLPEGIGFTPFKLPGSAELMDATVAELREHRIVIWAKHGVMARSDVSVKRAADRIEYAETAAKYEHLNLTVGEVGEGLSVDEIRAICAAFNLKQSIF